MPCEADRHLLQRFLEQQCQLVDQQQFLWNSMRQNGPSQTCGEAVKPDEIISQQNFHPVPIKSHSSTTVIADVHRSNVVADSSSPNGRLSSLSGVQVVDTVVAQSPASTFAPKRDPSLLRLDLPSTTVGCSTKIPQMGFIEKNTSILNLIDDTPPPLQSTTGSVFETPNQKVAPLAVPETLSSTATSLAPFSPMQRLKNWEKSNLADIEQNFANDNFNSKRNDETGRHSSQASISSFVTVKSHATSPMVGESRKSMQTTVRQQFDGT